MLPFLDPQFLGIAIGALDATHGLAAWADSGGPIETMRTAVPVALSSFLLTLLARLMGWKYWFVSGASSALILVMIAEAGQFFLPERRPSWGDVLWGAAGATGGLVLGLAVVLLVPPVLANGNWGRS